MSDIEGGNNDLSLSAEARKMVFRAEVGGAQAILIQEAEIQRSQLPTPQDAASAEVFKVEVESDAIDHDRGIAAFVIRKFEKGFTDADLVEVHDVYVAQRGSATTARNIASVRSMSFPRGRESVKVTGIDEKGEPVVVRTPIT